MDNIVIDTNVFVSALISKRGASFRLLSLVGKLYFNIAISVPLILEYEDAAKRLVGKKIHLSMTDLDRVIDYLCAVGLPQTVFFLWRPYLHDPKDDMVLELAIAADCQVIVTHNERDFKGSEKFGVRVITPQVFLKEIGELS